MKLAETKKRILLVNACVRSGVRDGEKVEESRTMELARHLLGKLDGKVEEIDIEKEGKDIVIGFNPKFILDALRVIDDETVSIYFVNSKAPCFIRDDEGRYVYLILPVNINR